MSARLQRSLGSRLRRDEHGGMLVEVLVSAVILLTVSAGVVGAFSTTQKQSRHQRAQAVASNLAASELERLRSLRFSDLPGLDVTLPPRDVDGVTYTIKSKSSSALDPVAGGNGCDIASRSPEALSVTTTVTWPNMGNRKPVVLQSMIAAPADSNSQRGSVVVQVINKDGFGVNGLGIAMTGASNVSGTTDENGCVRFTDLIPGAGASAYHLKFRRTNWTTTPDGREEVDDVVDVVKGQTQTKSYQYDPLAPAQVTFFTKYGSTETNAAMPGATWTHSNLTADQVQTVNPFASTIVSDPLLPMQTSNYGVYAGTCTAAKPPLANIGSVKTGSAVRVQVPLLRVSVLENKANNPKAINGASVWVTDTCGAKWRLGLSGDSGATGVTDGPVPYTATGTIALCAVLTGEGVVKTTATATSYATNTYGNAYTLKLGAGTQTC